MKRFRRMERQWEKANARAVLDYEKDLLAIVKHGVADSILSSPAQGDEGGDGTPRRSTKGGAASHDTPIARNRQNKVTDLLREKVSQLEALTAEREAHNKEIDELKVKCERLEKTLSLTSAASSELALNGTTTKTPSPQKPAGGGGASTSGKVAALMQKWKDLGVDEGTQQKIMGDLQMSVDERADKYINHLSEEYAEQQECIAAIETQVTQKLELLGKPYVASNVYNIDSSTLGIPADSVLEKKRKLQEYLKNVDAQVQKQKTRYAELRTRARELVAELDVKEDEMGDELRGLLVRAVLSGARPCHCPVVQFWPADCSCSLGP